MKYIKALSSLADKFLVKLSQVAPTEIVKVFHADHGVSKEMMQWAVDEIKPSGFFLKTLELPSQFPDLQNGLHGPRSGDEAVGEDDVHMKQRSPDRPMSRMTKRPKRATRLMTIIGMATADGVTVYTAHGGPAAEREVGDVSLTTDEDKEASRAFWSEHALSSEE